MAIADVETSRRTVMPTILVVGCSPGFAARCAVAARRAGAVVRRAEIGSFAAQLARHRPLVVVVPRAVYEFDKSSFDVLTNDLGADLLALSGEEVDDDALATLISFSALSSSRRRAVAPQ